MVDLGAINMRFPCVMLDFRHVYIFLAIMIDDRLCSDACMPDGKPPQLPVIISQISAGSDGFIRFYMSSWKCFAKARQSRSRL